MTDYELATMPDLGRLIYQSLTVSDVDDVVVEDARPGSRRAGCGARQVVGRLWRVWNWDHSACTCCWVSIGDRAGDSAQVNHPRAAH